MVARAADQAGDRRRRDPPWSAWACFAATGVTPIRGGPASGSPSSPSDWGFAVWARVHIGRNWGTPMTQKVEPELVTSGPYRLVRHPIYSGILIAGLGTAVALSWLLADRRSRWPASTSSTARRSRSATWPSSSRTTIPAYKRSTKMLVPFLF